MTYQKLYRSPIQKVFGGVAGGIGEYLNVDPVIIRLIFAIAIIFGGGGLLIYLILWIAIPLRPIADPMFKSDKTPPPPGSAGDNQEQFNADDWSSEKKYESSYRGYEVKQRNTSGLIVGIILICAGALILASRLIPGIYFRNLWPFILLIAGIALILTSFSSSGRE
ncbi:MAG: PspC domain-containing protein [Bacteroidales bacterium]|jgi:phage shock protein C|nr:PspC domain-containing protein [Bacteroidales bacterium]